ncbi:hypothetical protein RhiirC2_789079 [Rhizophagus irregularis]|uniref:Uncharacterized protein n=1 Tax=Rhizophagus irregularis TaxID=588596 RepID=A0A2N1MNV7_9GLOM|nr:hypothetical protein RhiirC2_789079 [Rhizophagus irregularis]
MENIHTIWDSSTIGKRKKLGNPTNDRYSIKMKQSHGEDISQAQKLEIAIDNGLFLFKKCKKLHNTCNKLVNENEQLRNNLLFLQRGKIITNQYKNGSNLEQQIAYLKGTHEYDKQRIQKIDVLNLRLKELEFILSLKITEIHTLLSSSKTLELQDCEVELSSKTFDLQTLKTECGVFKQYDVFNMAGKAPFH